MYVRALLALTVMTAACSKAPSPPDSGTTFVDGGGPVQLLFVRHSAGFNHASRDAASTALAAIAIEQGYGLTISDDVATSITAEQLAKTHVLIFYTSGELPLSAEQKTAMLDYLQRGGGFIGVHSATDTLYQWPEYNDVIGAQFDGHPWTEDVTVRVDSPDSGIVGALSPSFQISDELYQFKNWRPGSEVLLSLDTSSVDLNAPGVHQNAWGFPLAWTRSYGAGRVFYLALGHPESTWSDPRIRALLARAIFWSSGR